MAPPRIVHLNRPRGASPTNAAQRSPSQPKPKYPTLATKPSFPILTPFRCSPDPIPVAAAVAVASIADAAVVRIWASMRTPTTHTRPWRIPSTNILLSTENLDPPCRGHPPPPQKEIGGDREGTTGGKLWRYFMYSLPPK
jgi:hypothetical protein